MKKLLVALAAVMVGTFAAAAPPKPVVAVPYYTPPTYAQGLQRDWLQARSADFAEAATRLVAAVGTLCGADAAAADPALREARTRWAATTQAWDRLSTVAIGPVLQRRSTRQIDFSPTRPEQIERTIAALPADAAAMDRVGSSAKGLPALEWLLWARPVRAMPSDLPACRYAGLVAQDIAREAEALRQAAATELDEEATLAEALNQWTGAIEALRWRHLERPLKSRGGGRDAPAFPRSASGQTAGSWAAQWQALRRFAVLPGGATPPQPGAGLVSFETYLRGLGLNPLADALAGDVARTDAAMQRLKPGDARSVQAAAGALAALKRRVEAEVAPALKVSIGFSDADGD